ncbi:LysE family transporter [Pseudomonas sp. CM25]|uniref:LysE family transporter n=1 Tax=Pseudomonas sp. CM25 TaxID=2738448 RepID=UPI002114D34C|nr:LysE family transporter [Pseudomonas sp. CM25]
MITPGPSMLLALSNGAARGMRVASFGMAGAALSDLILIGAVGCGLGALGGNACLRSMRSGWELACRRWAAQQPSWPAPTCEYSKLFPTIPGLILSQI